jgi:hypothetical protein
LSCAEGQQGQGIEAGPGFHDVAGGVQPKERTLRSQRSKHGDGTTAIGDLKTLS